MLTNDYEIERYGYNGAIKMTKAYKRQDDLCTLIDRDGELKEMKPLTTVAKEEHGKSQFTGEALQQHDEGQSKILEQETILSKTDSKSKKLVRANERETVLWKEIMEKA